MRVWNRRREREYAEYRARLAAERRRLVAVVAVCVVCVLWFAAGLAMAVAGLGLLP